MTDQLTDDLDENWDADYTEGYRLRCYLEDFTAAFADGTHPELDRDRCGADTYPEKFARLVSAWNNCLCAANTINARYYEDWNRHAGALTVIAADVRDAALSSLAELWKSLCEQYISETVEADRQPWDCPFCGEDVPRAVVFDIDRCPDCMCILILRDDEEGWE